MRFVPFGSFGVSQSRWIRGRSSARTRRRKSSPGRALAASGALHVFALGCVAMLTTFGVAAVQAASRRPARCGWCFSRPRDPAAGVAAAGFGSVRRRPKAEMKGPSLQRSPVPPPRRITTRVPTRAGRSRRRRRRRADAAAGRASASARSRRCRRKWWRPSPQRQRIPGSCRRCRRSAGSRQSGTGVGQRGRNRTGHRYGRRNRRGHRARLRRRHRRRSVSTRQRHHGAWPAARGQASTTPKRPGAAAWKVTSCSRCRPGRRERRQRQGAARPGQRSRSARDRCGAPMAILAGAPFRHASGRDGGGGGGVQAAASGGWKPWI